MKTKQLFLLCMWSTLLLYCTSDRWPQYFNTILVNYELAEASYSVSNRDYRPPVEKRKAKNKKRRKQAKMQLKKKLKGIKDKTQTTGTKPGFIIMLIGGLIVGALAIYLGTLIIPWSAGLSLGCSSAGLGAIFLGALAWFGWIVICLVALALIIHGIIWTVYFSNR